MLCLLRIGPAKLAYKAVHGSYYWNWCPLAPLGCKAVIYKSPDSHGTKGSSGTNAWCVGPSLNHYHCNHYFVPNKWAYYIFRSAKLFLQHCQELFLMWNNYLQEVLYKLVTMLWELEPSIQKGVLTLINDMLSTVAPPTAPRTPTYPAHEWLLPASDPQQAPRLVLPEQRVTLPAEQRVDAPNPSNNPIVFQITDTPPIIMAPNPTTNCSLKATPHTHQRLTGNNIPSSVPPISNINDGPVITATPEAKHAPHRSSQTTTVMRTTP